MKSVHLTEIVCGCGRWNYTQYVHVCACACVHMRECVFVKSALDRVYRHGFRLLKL
jgi:hypothetical protein